MTRGRLIAALIARLRLIFTCRHPAIDANPRVTLTLRTRGGLTTPEIAGAFLDTDTAMGARRTYRRITCRLCAGNLHGSVIRRCCIPDQTPRQPDILTGIFEKLPCNQKKRPSFRSAKSNREV